MKDLSYGDIARLQKEAEENAREMSRRADTEDMANDFTQKPKEKKVFDDDKMLILALILILSKCCDDKMLILLLVYLMG